VDVAPVGLADSLRDRLHDRVVRLVLPALEVVAAHPDDVVEVSVAVAQVAAVVVRRGDAVGEQDAEEAPGLGRIEHDHDAVPRRDLQHVIDAGEVAGVRSRQVHGRRERDDPVERAPVGPPARVRAAEQIDPGRVEAVRPETLAISACGESPISRKGCSFWSTR
jgi:hypothetical protein